MSVPARDDPRWGPVPLPEHIKEIRPQQWDIIQEGVGAFSEGDDVLFIEAPTGAGKSFIAEGIRRIIKARAVYSCTTKALQDQLVRSFPYGKVIKGRANYDTELGKVDEFGNPWNKSWSAITCAECTAPGKPSTCNWCTGRHACPYIQAKEKAISSDLAILNTSYWLLSAEFRARDLVVLDEADLLEGEILNHISVEMSPRTMSKLGIDPPRFKTKPESWANWMYATAMPALTDFIQTHPITVGMPDFPEKLREVRHMRNLYERIYAIKPQVAMGNWIYDGYDEKGGEDRVRFSPIMIDRAGENLVWPAGKKFILMSATILSADLMAEELGLYLPYKSISVPSTFPKANRPIYVCPIADMSFKAKEQSGGQTWRDMVEAIRAILRRHSDERILVHTVSYEFARYLKGSLGNLPRQIITYTTSEGKGDALRQYTNSKNSVMLAASMDRGIDLPDDLCRVQVLAKVPFPNHKKDKRVAARMYKPGGQNWYKSMVIRTIIQACGRGVRHENDHAWTYILDKQFTDNVWQSEFLFPNWFKEAMVWSLTPRALLRSN